MKNPLAFLLSRKEEEGKVQNRHLFNYALGLAGQNVTYGYVNNWLNYFCINLLHIEPKKVGRIFFASYFWDALNDPIIGAVIDKRRFKNGEKLRPFLLYLPPVIGALSAMMFFNVRFDENGKLIYILLVYLAWDLVYSIQDTALWGMVAVSSPLSDERARVAQWVSIGAAAGGAIVGSFQMVRSVLGRFGLSDMTIFILFGFIFALGGELVSMRAHKMPEAVRSEMPKENIWQSLALLRFNRTLIVIVVARLVASFNPRVGSPYFFETMVSYDIGRVHIDGKAADFLVGLLSGIPGSFAVFFATKIAKKVGGMKRVLVLAQLISISLRGIGYLVGYKSIWQMALIVVLNGIMSIPNSIMDIAHRSLLSDSIDDLEWKTGVRTEGISFSMQNFVSKMTGGFGKLIEGEILSRLGYDSIRKAKNLPQNMRFQKSMWPMYIAGPAVGSILYLIAISFMRDDKTQKERIENDLRERRKLLAAQRDIDRVAVLTNETSGHE